MGWTIIGGACLGLLFIVVLWFLVFRALRLAIPAAFAILFSIPVMALPCGGIWYLLNEGNIKKQAKMDSVDKDCGWTQYKPAQPVDGLYLEEIGFERVLFGPPYGRFGPYPPPYEHSDGLGHLILITKDAPHIVAIPKRTFRYGIRNVQESIGTDILRHTSTYMDFENGDVYAKSITYTFEPTPQPFGVAKVLLSHLRYPLHDCTALENPQAFHGANAVFYHAPAH
jgi:hypothetical protein